MNVRKTKSGWVVEITNEVYGMLEQGGVSGREELYTRETLTRCGIDYEADPHAFMDGLDYITHLDYLMHSSPCDRVLRKGHLIN